MSKNLLYKPDLSYDKNYYTDGSLFIPNDSIQDNINSDNSSNNLNNKLDDLNNIINDLLNKIELVPDNIKNTIKPSIEIIDKVIEDLNNNREDDSDNKKDDEIKIIPVYKDEENNNDNNLDKVPDDPFKSESNNTIDIPNKDINIGEEIERQYKEDLIDILKHYITKKNLAINKYINSLIAYSTYIEKDKGLKVYTSKNITNKDLTHITDYLTKSKIGIKQKIRLYNKTFNIDETIYHLKAIKVAKEQLKRYKTNKRIEDTNLLTKNANNLLIESRLVAEKKYEENFYALYKYLNSSVIIFSECLNIYIKQKNSLILLNNKEREK